MDAREANAAAYLDHHKILQLFENWTALLFFERPENPKKYLATRLQEMIHKRDGYIPTDAGLQGGLFEERNIRGMFEMMDPMKSGVINVEQYAHGLACLGAKRFDPVPANCVDGKVTYEMFREEAIKALNDLYAAFCPEVDLSITDEFPEFGHEEECSGNESFLDIDSASSISEGTQPDIQ